MAWTTLNYSKKSITKAGQYLVTNYQHAETPLFALVDPNKIDDALAKLSNWRSSHAYPMQSMLGYFRKKAFEIDSKAVIVQRLKRTPSIIEKLKRENGMQLSRMQDVAGCRIVVDDLKTVYEVRQNIINGRTRNSLKNETNYLETPKESGYRGIHLIYQYNGQKEEFRTHVVELQIRSRIQHAWATAVEVVGTYTGEALKASEGNHDWLRLFKLASIAFEDIENKNLLKNAKTPERIELKKLIHSLNVIARLKAFTVSTDHISKKRGAYFLLTLKIDEKRINIRRFQTTEQANATNEYYMLEKIHRTNKNRDVVLVSARTITGLKKAYPNYFADTKEFVANIERIINH